MNSKAVVEKVRLGSKDLMFYVQFWFKMYDNELMCHGPSFNHTDFSECDEVFEHAFTFFKNIVQVDSINNGIQGEKASDSGG